MYEMKVHSPFGTRASSRTGLVTSWVGDKILSERLGIREVSKMVEAARCPAPSFVPYIPYVANPKRFAPDRHGLASRDRAIESGSVCGPTTMS